MFYKCFSNIHNIFFVHTPVQHGVYKIENNDMFVDEKQITAELSFMSQLLILNNDDIVKPISTTEREAMIEILITMHILSNKHNGVPNALANDRMYTFFIIMCIPCAQKVCDILIQIKLLIY